MFTKHSTRTTVAALAFGVMIVGFVACQARADEGHTGHNHAAAGDNHADHQHTQMKPHHGGQLAKSKSYCFEVVYQPKETRIYLYDHNQRHLSMRGVSGEAALQVRGNDQVYRFPIKFVAAENRNAHDYLAMSADVSRVRDGDMQVTFHMKGLPVRSETVVRFTQTFALSRQHPTVTVSQLSQGDQAAISRQAVCPVMGTSLGHHGKPVKLMIGEVPLYVCCKGCISKVQRAPEHYLAKAKVASRR